MISTDLPVLVDGLLTSNIARNETVLAKSSESASIGVAALDWTESPSAWKWPGGSCPGRPFDLIVSSDSSKSRGTSPRDDHRVY